MASGPKSNVIELELRDVSQLFNSMDPSPFHERDLDSDAEEFIVSWASEFPADEPLTLRVYLKQWPAEDPTATIREGVHNYFAYRAKMDSLEFHRLMSQGRTSLAIGLLFLGFCLAIIHVFLPRGTSTMSDVGREGLTIVGWVAMWRPMEIYLYDWWPLKRRGRIHAKLSEMPVEVMHKP